MTVTCPFRWNRYYAMPLLLIAAMSLGEACRGLDILLTFDDTTSELPAFDPTAAKLQSLFAAAEASWERIIQDPGLVVVNYRYLNIGSLAEGAANAVVSGKPLSGTINVDSDPRAWYFDTTPLDSSEFAMTQSLVRDLSLSQQSAWYAGSPPELLEASFRGTALASAPSEAKNGFDMFTVILHEMGHVLGLSSMQLAWPETVGEGDFDYDVNPEFVGGATMAVRTHGTDPNEIDDWAHLRAESLMCDACEVHGFRRLPSATDIFAVASASNWSQIDLPRRDVLGSGSWQDASIWEGNRVPDETDDVWVRGAAALAFTGDGTAKNLAASEGSLIDVASHSLTVADVMTLVGSGGESATELKVAADGHVTAQEFIFQEAKLTIDGGTVHLNSADLEGQIQLVDGNSQLILGSGSMNDTSRIAASTIFSGSGVVSLETESTTSIEYGADLSIAIENRGRLDLGDTVGAVTLGQYTQASTGSLAIRIGGPIAGVEHDVLHVTGTADLAGTIDVVIDPDYSLGGESFAVLMAAQVINRSLQVAGPFADLFLLTVDEDLGIVTLAPKSLVGDYNQDGVVNAADYVVWRDNDGMTGMLPNDAIGGMIGQAQYEQWRATFSAALPPNSSLGWLESAVEIPEPATGRMLLLCLLISLLGCRYARWTLDSATGRPAAVSEARRANLQLR